MVKPGVPFSTTRVANFGPLSSVSSVRASKVTPNDISVPALEMNVFVPLITHPPSRRPARVRMPRASEPASGSVSANAPRTRPSASGRSHRSRWASLPKRSRGSDPMVTCACNAGRHRLVGQPDLLHRGHESNGRYADAAPFFGHEHPEEPELAHLREQVGRTASLLPRSRGANRDLPLSEITAQLDQRVFGFIEGEVHICRCHCTDKGQHHALVARCSAASMRARPFK